MTGWERIERERTETAPSKNRKTPVKSKNNILLCNIIQLSQMKTENGGLVKSCSLPHVFLIVQRKMLRKYISILISAHKASQILKKGYRGIFFSQNIRKNLPPLNSQFFQEVSQCIFSLIQLCTLNTNLLQSSLILYYSV